MRLHCISDGLLCDSAELIMRIGNWLASINSRNTITKYCSFPIGNVQYICPTKLEFARTYAEWLEMTND